MEGPGTSPAQCEPRPTPGPVGHPRWLPACPLEGRAAPEDKVCRRVPPGPGPTNEGARGVPACCLREQEPVLCPGQGEGAVGSVLKASTPWLPHPFYRRGFGGGVSEF